MRKILIRFDDICESMDWEQWKKATDILDSLDIKPVIGVIPNCMDPDLQIGHYDGDYWAYIRQLQKQKYTIAMHGYTHLFDIQHKGLLTKRLDSEFAGHPYDVQFRKIHEGKKLLEERGIYTNIFFAPAHSYDQVTLKALYDNGFKYLLDGKSNKNILRNNIICIPCRDAGVPHIYNNGRFVAIFHAHEWRAKDKLIEFEHFKRVCKMKGVCTFEQYADEKCGMYLIQVASEKIYIWYDLHIRPNLSKIKKSLMRIIRGDLSAK